MKPMPILKINIKLSHAVDEISKQRLLNFWVKKENKLTEVLERPMLLDDKTFVRFALIVCMDQFSNSSSFTIAAFLENNCRDITDKKYVIILEDNVAKFAYVYNNTIEKTKELEIDYTPYNLFLHDKSNAETGLSVKNMEDKCDTILDPYHNVVYLSCYDKVRFRKAKSEFLTQASTNVDKNYIMSFNDESAALPNLTNDIYDPLVISHMALSFFIKSQHLIDMLSAYAPRFTGLLVTLDLESQLMCKLSQTATNEIAYNSANNCVDKKLETSVQKLGFGNLKTYMAALNTVTTDIVDKSDRDKNVLIVDTDEVLHNYNAINTLITNNEKVLLTMKHFTALNHDNTIINEIEDYIDTSADENDTLDDITSDIIDYNVKSTAQKSQRGPQTYHNLMKSIYNDYDELGVIQTVSNVFGSNKFFDNVDLSTAEKVTNVFL